MEDERELVLCFDGTGNTYRADGSESNILKIFRMLDRTASDQCGCSRVRLLVSYRPCLLTCSQISDTDHYYQRK